MNDHEPSFFAAMREQIVDTPIPARSRSSLSSLGLGARARFSVGRLAGASAALAAVLAAVVLALDAGGGATPAYAVTIGPDNGVTIVLTELKDIGLLNARLTALHTRIRAVPMVRGCKDPVHSVIGAYDGVPAHVAPGPAQTIIGHRALRIVVMSETLENNTLPGRTLIVPVTSSGQHANFAVSQRDVVVGSVPHCVGEGRPEALIGS